MRYLLGILAVGTSLVVAYAGYVVGGLACDEGCYDGGRWTRNAEAWQWDAVQILSGSLPVAACLLFVAVIARGQHVALGFLVLQAAVTAVLVGFVAVAESLADRIWPEAGVLAFVPVLLGVGALVALRTDARRASGP